MLLFNVSTLFGSEYFYNSTTTSMDITSASSAGQRFIEMLQNYSRTAVLIDDPLDICDDGWLPINHMYFQLANVFLFLSYLAPNGIYGVLYLRITLTIGCFFFSLWGYVVLCALDTFLWNAIFVVINLCHAVFICYILRPVKFSKEIEQVYGALFKPLRVSRHQFKRVLKCMKQIKTIKFQEIYAKERVTRVDSLSLVLCGRLVISQNGRALHIVSQHQFLDSPEWFGVSTDEFFQVSATAIESSRLLIWHRDKLKLTIKGDQFMQSVFDHILGRDVVKKLMQVNDGIGTLSNGHSHHLSDGQIDQQISTSSSDVKESAKSLLVIKKNDDSGCLTTIFNRPLQENSAHCEEDELLVPMLDQQCSNIV